MRLLQSRSLWAFVAVGAIIATLYFVSKPRDAANTVDVVMPALTEVAEDGATLFNENCAGCHGPNAAGSDRGPPLVHELYRASHHADVAFWLAALRGVPAHHWRFGNMPPQPQVTEEDVAKITVYVRELQAANGIQ